MADIDANEAVTEETAKRIMAAAAARAAELERLFIVRPDSKRLATVWGERGGSEWQDSDDHAGDWFVILGSETTDEQCERMAKKFGLSAGGLIAMRDDPRWEECECRRWGPLQ